MAAATGSSAAVAVSANSTTSTDDMESEDTKPKLGREVVIVKHGRPVMKVETGTTLGVVKLLCEAESGQSVQILGVRPKSSDSMPCIVTLDESKLSEPQYDLLVLDKNHPQEKMERLPVTSDRFSTTKCIECSRESWKSKKFTNTGMNTEVSVNPSIDIDLRIFSGINGTHGSHYAHVLPSSQQTVNQFTTSRINRFRSGPVRPNITGSSGSIVHCNNIRKDISSVAHPGHPINGKHEMEPGMIRPMNQSPKLSTSPVLESPNSLYNNYQHSGNNPSKYVKTILHSESVNYDSSKDLPSPQESSRSPSQANNVDQLAQSNENVPMKQESDDSAPTVYVLPNDYDIVSGLEPHLPEYTSHVSHHHHDEMPNSVHKMHHHDDMALRKVHHHDDIAIHKFHHHDDMTVGMHNSHIKLHLRPKEGPDMDLPTQVTMADVSGGQLENFKSSPPNSASGSPNSLNEDTGSPGGDGIANGQKLYCKICHRDFPTKSLLYKHLRGHSSDEKPYKCQECGQGFTLSSNLRQHRIIHRGYKPFQCEFCGKKFMRSNVYKQHRRIHTGEEMHKCTLCPSEFLQKYALIKHMKKQHDIDTGEIM